MTIIFKNIFTYYKSILILLIIFISINIGNTQVSFTKVDNFIQDVYSAYTILSVDMNEDQQDDLVFFDEGRRITVQLNNAQGRNWKKINGPVLAKDAWSGLAVDLNNDGFKEIVCGTVSTEIRIYTFNHLDETFTLYWEADISFLVQNMNAVDINNDGFLDLFACNDKGENYFFINDGEEGLNREEIIDFTTDPVSDKSGNYGSQFLDFDLDGDEDLYISKCSAFAEDATDPRRINQLFVNDGNGNYEDKADQYGLASGSQTWVSDFADIDLDGDLDVILANHQTELMLMENINNDTFVEIQDVSGIELFDSFWDLAYHDIDNDGYEDIILTGTDVLYYHNNGDKTFTKNTLESSPNSIKSGVFTMGDYNSDGFWDICLSYGILGVVDIYADSIFMNDGNDNHWITLMLEGVESPKDAAGTRVELIKNGVSQNRFLKYGRSYGVMHSPRIHFGLGADENYDEIKIYWKDGSIEIFSDLEVDKVHYVLQGSCHLDIENTTGNTDEICIGESYTLNYAGDDLISWNIGSNENTISYNQNDVVFAQYGEGDCILNSHTLFPIYSDTSMLLIEEQLTDGIYNYCQNEIVLLDVPDSMAIWNGSTISESFVSHDDASIYVEYQNICNSVLKTFFREDLVSDFDLDKNYYQFAIGTDVKVETSDDSTRWYNEVFDEQPFYIGAEYSFLNLQENMEFYVESYVNDLYSSSCGEETHVNGSYPGASINAGTYFTVHESIELESIKVFTDIEGLRSFLVINLETDEIIEFGINVISGENIIELGMILEPGSYLLKTDEFFNNMNFGENGPFFLRHANSDVSYPYKDEKGTIEITGNTFDVANSYYFFYDWKVEALEEKICIGEREKVTLESVVYTTIADIKFTYTNPVTTNLVVKSPISEYISIYNLTGDLMATRYHSNESTWDLSGFIPGFYIIRSENKSFPLIIH